LTANGVPRRPHDIDLSVFQGLTARDDAVAIRICDVNHGTATRARIEITGAPGLPTTAFAKLAATRPAERLLNRLMGLAHNETEVYRLLRSELNDVMPNVYGTASDGRGRAVVIMEDLASGGAVFPPMEVGATAQQALAVAAALAGLHRTYWMSGRFAGHGDLAGFGPNRSRSSRFGPHSWHLLRTIPRDFDDVAPQDVRSEAKMLITQRWPIVRLMRTYPYTFTHGDTHLGNMCFRDDRPILFDWQVASSGPAVKDLAYFAATSIDPETRRTIDRQLVTTYVNALNSDGITRLEYDQAWDSYRMFAITAYIAAGVTAAFGRRLQGEAIARAGLDRAVQALRDLGSFDELRRRLRGMDRP
jgi:aminoglycoside phosphotransferase (APT) family kinase protein